MTVGVTRAFKWHDLYLNLKSKGFDVAAPFTGYKPQGYQDGPRRILYVGKATGGSCDSVIFERELAKGNSHANLQTSSWARDVFEGSVGRSGPSFWGFANDLARVVDPKSSNLQNVAWSNLCKIGTSTGNPSPSMLKLEIDEAVETLAEEIEETNPSLIVFVSNSYADQIVHRTLNISSSDWLKSEDYSAFKVDNVWWRQKSKALPALLWLPHPQGLDERVRLFALLKAQSLIEAQS